MLLHKRLKLASSFRRLSRERYGRRNAVDLTVAPIDRAVSGIAEPSHRFGERIEHWLEIESRAADDLQNLADRGLLLQRFTRLCDEARILHCNDRLRGKILQ